MNFKRVITNTMIVLATCLIMLLALEAATRAYSALFFPMLRIPDEQLGWRHAADREKSFINESGEEKLIVQNANGHRGPFYSSERAPEKFRVLVLGDSFTEGVQVNEDELFTARLEASNADWEVLNSGVGSYSTAQQYLYLLAEGLDFDPDLILLMFFNNDLFENCLPYSPGIGPRPYARIDDSGAVTLVQALDYDRFAKFALPMPFWSTLLEHSYFYNFLNSRIYQALAAEQMKEFYLADRNEPTGCAEDPILFHLLSEIAARAAERDIQFIVTLIPEAEEVATNHSAAHRRILDFCATAGLSCLSLVDSLHASLAAGQRPYFDKDIHWTVEGHRVAAQSIESFIRLTRNPDADGILAGQALQ